MKKLKAIFYIRIFALVITLYLVSAIFPGQISAQQNDVNYQEFYDQLSPYGQWIEDNNYGYVWIPTAGPDFAPYLTNGYWILTDYGWMWVSDYNWGWATFHYGRWDYNGSYGWFWVPDYEWGPSWVTWRRSNGYYGWAPMRPGISISVTFGGYNDVPNDRWIFVRDRDIERHDIGRNYIDRKNNSSIMNNSTVINKTYYDDKRRTTYVAGPGREDVQKITGKTINPVTVREKDKPGQSLNNDQVQIYRPQVQKNNNGLKPAPSELTKLKDVKRISERNAEKQPQNIQLQNSKTGKGQQQPAGNPTQQRNTNPPNNNINKGQQPAVNSVNKVDTKKNAYQPRNLDPPKKENKKDQPSQLRNTNPPINNGNTNQPNQPRYLDPPKKENKIDRPLQPQNKIVPKNNNTDQPPKARTVNPPKNNSNTNQPPKVRTVNPPKNQNMDQPSKSIPKDDKKENRKPE
ncbi:MAG: hypothetical protein NTZ27_12265 [Ignavibacteriales bacterium]|nr:hypothetical protein [Ignavibacteriales bacterium]